MILVRSDKSPVERVITALEAVAGHLIFVNVPCLFNTKKIQMAFMKLLLAAAVGCISVAGFACRHNDKRAGIGSSSEVSAESVFLDYQVMGEEGNDSITLLLQFRAWNEYGGTLLLDPPGAVQLDGEFIKADSANVTGAYYEIQKPVAGFNGDHTILFTYNADKKNTAHFTFQQMELATEIPPRVYHDSLDLSFRGLDSGDLVRVLLTDTLFGSEGIDRLDTVKNGHIIITPDNLKMLTNGPIQLQLVKESETPIKNGDKRRGRLYMSYRLKREFLLDKRAE
jgi:hypothetical protein